VLAGFIQYLFIVCAVINEIPGRKKSEVPAFAPDADDASPLYLQLARNLGDACETVVIRCNEALPSERNLSESLGVLARDCTQRAIDQLVDQGFDCAQRGSGNYIVK
jgi:GntR family transcriptional regulator